MIFKKVECHWKKNFNQQPIKPPKNFRIQELEASYDYGLDYYGIQLSLATFESSHSVLWYCGRAGRHFLLDSTRRQACLHLLNDQTFGCRSNLCKVRGKQFLNIGENFCAVPLFEASAQPNQAMEAWSLAWWVNILFSQFKWVICVLFLVYKYMQWNAQNLEANNSSKTDGGV